MSAAGLELSVVIPTVGRAALLERTLRGVLAQTLEPERFEVIVVSDGPDPETAALLARLADEERAPLRHLTRVEGPGSPGATRNLGWRAAAGGLIAFIDDDCEPVPPWLASALEAHHASPDSLVQGPTRTAPEDERLRGPFSRVAAIEQLGPYFQGCNIFYPRSLLEQLDGFDESFERWGEDVDLGWRALESGAGATWAEGAIAYHAVVAEGPAKHLRFAGREAATVRLMKRHRGLRLQTAHARFFVKRSHARLLLALLGLILARRVPAAALLGLPYLKGLRGRAGAADGGPSLMAYLLLNDVIEVGVTTRAAAAERTALI